MWFLLTDGSGSTARQVATELALEGHRVDVLTPDPLALIRFTVHGASYKRSVDLPMVREYLAELGSRLKWHGTLSAEVILRTDGPSFVDINPRLVEPANARRAGVNLVDAIIAVALCRKPSPQAAGRVDVATHQFLLAVLGAAQSGQARRGVLRELRDALRHRASYKGSMEELTPVSHDPRTAFPVVVAALATLAWPRSWRHLSSSAVSNYALSPGGWKAITSWREHRRP